MYLNRNKVKIIAEVHPQHHGDMDKLKRMVLQCKIGGADYVKVQVYNSEKLFNDDKRKYLEFNESELQEINSYCLSLGIELFASVFSLEGVDLCEKIGFKIYKIASRSINENKKLCDKILSLNKPVIASLGMYDWKKNGLPFKQNNNVKYLYCVSNYPTKLEEIKMPNFKNEGIHGFSDHTIGIGACLHAVSLGAEYIEKHFSTNKSLNVSTELAHTCSMDFEDLKKLRELADTISLISK
tara:strand:+ start:547 stop:1266 length:720 start_codon:yes stop_codon:yes gene_type:complete